jgi:hypothetical protein
MQSRTRRVERGAGTAWSLGQALGAWQAAVVRLERVDAVTTELVRLRCARHHDCHT